MKLLFSIVAVFFLIIFTSLWAMREITNLGLAQQEREQNALAQKIADRINVQLIHVTNITVTNFTYPTK